MRIDAPAASAPPARLPWVDEARGIAILAMVVYHFSWDLSFFRLIETDVGEAFGWRLFARIIAGSFLFLVGFSLVLATRGGIRWRPYFRRLALVAAAAAAITIVTWFVFPESFVFFGILHHIAVASVLGLVFVRAPLWLVALAALVAVAAPAIFAAPVFDHPALLWLGLYTEPPMSNDYVPVFPWFSLVLSGIVAARVLAGRLAAARPGAPGRAGRGLVWLGRHSLAIYLVHQPVLFGSMLALQAFGAWTPAVEREFVANCVAACVATARDEALCRRACPCVLEQTKASGIWDALQSGLLSDEDQQIYADAARQCFAGEAR
ncbi:heparan-alpha-glucosaminide N-acetyltransferase [Faunimonas sp. B44]|uniref:heparan-alpha-glucosaminide N-acetyltransferase n=1 Tax=Faunimonas sp. B44 TaxID=3461493 RepID=UPI0040447645